MNRWLGSVRRSFTPSFDTALAAQAPQWARGAAIVISFDVETRKDCEALPLVLAGLASRDLKASFACIGAWVDAYPAQHRAVVSAGHEVLNHTDTHPSHDELGTAQRFDDLSDEALAREVSLANAKMSALGTQPRGFRSPHFGAMHTSRVYPILERLGFAYSSSTVAIRTPHGGAPFRVGRLWEFPLTRCPRHVGALLDSWHCTTAPDAAHQGPELVVLYQDALDVIARRGAFASFYWDPRVVLLPEYGAVLDLIARSRGDVRVVRYVDLLAELP